MIPVLPITEPTDFEEKARKPGSSWLKANPHAQRPHPYWGAFRDELGRGFRHLCAYSAMLDFNGTVDHFKPYKTHPHLTYEWSNYRYATGWINSGKKNRVFLDPFEVREGWFEVQIPSMLLLVTDKMPLEVRASIEGDKGMLKWLNGETFKNLRSNWYKQYKDGKLPLETLREYAPLIAAAVER